MDEPIVTCQHCGGEIETGSSRRRKWCSQECANAGWKQRHGVKSTARENGIPTNTVGAMAEILVWYDLLSRGWEVFRAISAAARCDVMAFKGQHRIRIEVRTGYMSQSGKLVFPKPRRDIGQSDHYAVVEHEPRRVTYLPPLP